MKHSPVRQTHMDVVSPWISSTCSTGRHSKDYSGLDAKTRSSTNSVVDSTAGTNDHFAHPVLSKVLWRKSVGRMVDRWNKSSATPIDEPDGKSGAGDGQNGTFIEMRDKQLEELDNRSDPSQHRLTKSATIIGMTSLSQEKNKSLLKRRSLGDFFGSISSRNMPKKKSKSIEALAETMGSSLSTPPPARAPTAYGNAPPMLPKLSSSGDLISGLQRGLGVDPKVLANGLSTSHSPDIKPTRPTRKDQAVQTSLSYVTERTDAKGRDRFVQSVPELVEPCTGHDVEWQNVSNALLADYTASSAGLEESLDTQLPRYSMNAQSVHKGSAQALSSKAKLHRQSPPPPGNVVATDDGLQTAAGPKQDSDPWAYPSKERLEEMRQQQLSSLPRMLEKKRKELGFSEKAWRECVDLESEVDDNTKPPRQKPRWKFWDRPQQEKVTDQLAHTSPMSRTVDYTRPMHTRDPGRQVFHKTATDNRHKDEASSGASAASDDAIGPTTASSDSSDMLPSSGSKTLNGNTTSLAFIRQFKIQPRDNCQKAPRIMSFEMDLHGANRALDGPNALLSF